MLEMLITHIFYFLSVFIIIFKLDQVIHTKDYLSKYNDYRELIKKTNPSDILRHNIIQQEYITKLTKKLIVPTLLTYVYIFIGCFCSFEWLGFLNLIIIDYLFSVSENKRSFKTKLLMIKAHNIIDIIILLLLYSNYTIWKFDFNGYMFGKLNVFN